MEDLWLSFSFKCVAGLDPLRGGEVLPDTDCVGDHLSAVWVGPEVPPGSSVSSSPLNGRVWRLRLRWLVVDVVVVVIVVVIFDDVSCGGGGWCTVAVGFHWRCAWLHCATAGMNSRVYLTFPWTVTLIATLLQLPFGSSRWKAFKTWQISLGELVSCDCSGFLRAAVSDNYSPLV